MSLPQTPIIAKDLITGPKAIIDCVHGLIELPPVCLNFIDTVEFQRLRDIKQLGCVFLVFPGATHSRFEHSIGTSYLAKKWVSLFKERQPDLGITERDIELVTLAGLLHDIGHGPFSHMFDGVFIPKVRPDLEGWSHEKASEMLFLGMVEKYKFDFDERDCKFICSLIRGEIEMADPRDQEKRFLFDIVANKRNSIDVDKFDYIARDCHYLALNVGFNVDRLLLSSRVIDNEVCFQDKQCFDLYEVFHSRYSLHKRCYTHKVAKAMEHMIVDALLAANVELDIGASVDDPEKYIFLTDSILFQIERSKGPALEKARSIIKDLRERKLYRFVDEVIVSSARETESVYKCLTEEMICSYSDNLKPEDIIVDRFVHNYAMKDENPVSKVYFFSRWESDKKFRVPPDSISGFVPTTFQDKYIRVYSKKLDLMFEIQKAFRKCLEEKWPKSRALLNSELKIPDHSSPMKRHMGSRSSSETRKAEEYESKRRLRFQENEIILED